MSIPLDLSGNFMEPRSDHFHAGLDMRTQGREGVPVRAVANGWVSRIKISPWGYGKAVYIDHPNGRTSVYGHLQRLEGPVAKACSDAQYRKKDFSIDLPLEKGVVPVKQGDVIGLSGNTGGSGGPHLHFEIRNTATQHALDPQANGFPISDRTPPEIIGVRFYPATDTSFVGPYPLRSVGYPARGQSGRYTLEPGTMPLAYGTVTLALHTRDRYDGMAAKFGVRRIDLFVDSVAYFSTVFDEIDFNTNRFCNAQMDYELFKESNMDYHRSYKQPNNKLRIYGQEPAQGRIEVGPGQERSILYVVTDANGNTSELLFTLRGATREEAIAWPSAELHGSLFRYDTENTLSEEGVSLTIPALSLYDDVRVRYERKPAISKSIGPVHVLHDPKTPLHLPSGLRVEVPTLDEKYHTKALIVRVDGKTRAVGGTYVNGTITANVKSFGSYTVMIDTVPPSIANVDLRASMAGRSGFSFKIADNLSGVDSWRATLDGNWILMEYEPKLDRLTHTFDEHSKGTGNREFVLVVTDERGNSERFTQQFTQ